MQHFSAKGGTTPTAAYKKYTEEYINTMQYQNAVFYAYYLHKEVRFHCGSCIVVVALIFIVILRGAILIQKVFLFPATLIPAPSLSLNSLYTLNCDGFCLFINENCFLNASGVINTKPPKKMNL